jgi:WD40 repeat protein
MRMISRFGFKNRFVETTLAHSGFVRSFAISLDGQTLASNSGGTLLIWDLKTGKYKTAFVDPNNTYISSVAISPDGQTIVSSYWKSNKNRASIKIGRCLNLKSCTFCITHLGFDLKLSQWILALPRHHIEVNPNLTPHNSPNEKTTHCQKIHHPQTH